MSTPRLWFASLICATAIFAAAEMPSFAADAARGGPSAVAAASVDPTRGAPAADLAKLNPALVDVQSVPVPEPTALFFAGFAGCVLLAVAQRLRGSKARQG